MKKSNTLMEKELLRLAEESMKAADTASKVDGVSADKRPEVTRCIALLKELKDFPVSFDVLASTQVDKRLRHLRNHSKERVRLMAKWLLEIWSVVIKDGLSRNQKKNGATVISVESRNDVESSRNKRKRDGEDRVSHFKKPIRETKVCKQEQQQITTESSDASRNKVREILLEGLRKVAGEISEEEMKEKVRSCDPVAVAVSVESVMFKKLGPFNGAKKLKYRSIMFNVKDPKNQDFRRKILVGEVKPERVVSMSTKEMASNERQRDIKRMEEKALSMTQESVGIADREAVWLESIK